MAAFAAIAWLHAAPTTLTDDNWTLATAEHVDVYTTGGEAVARRAVDYAERVHRYYEQVLHTETISGPRTKLIVFNRREDMDAFTANRAIRGFYQSSLDGDFIVLASLKNDAFPVLAHEYAHLFFRRSGQRYPLWLADGLAEYLSTITVQGTRLQVGAAPTERARALGFGVKLLPIERLVAITRDSADYNTPSRAGLFYAESWALVHMLLNDPRYQERAPAFFGRLAHDEPDALAFRAVYGLGLDELMKDLTRYTLRAHYRTSDVDLPMTAQPAAATTRPLDIFDAKVVLASLLGANPARRADARAAFDALALERPNDLGLIEAQAMFAVRADDFALARPSLDRAVAARSTNARIYAYAAEAQRTGTGPSDDVTEEALITKALELGSDDVDVRIVVARRRIVERRPAEALRLLAPVGRVPIEYQGLLDDTRALAQKLIKTPPAGH